MQKSFLIFLLRYLNKCPLVKNQRCAWLNIQLRILKGKYFRQKEKRTTRCAHLFIILSSFCFMNWFYKMNDCTKLIMKFNSKF